MSFLKNFLIQLTFSTNYHLQLMQRDYHFVSTIDRHDVISGLVVAVVALGKSRQVGLG